MSKVDGRVSPGWEQVRDAFAEGQRDDPGHAQLAVYHHGRPVVDLWAGPPASDGPDGRRTRVGQSRTADDGGDGIGILMSVSKGIVATCAHMLIEQGALDPGRPVVAYWPEFGAAGKRDTTVADLLSHRAGLPAFDPGAPAPPSWLLDWDEAVKRLAAQPPAWTPGRCHLYHPFTFGHLVGEVIRRITGDTVGAFFHREIAVPLGLSVWIGLPEDAESRFVAQFSLSGRPTPEQIRQRLTAVGVEPSTPLGVTLTAMANESHELIALFGTRAGRAAQVPAANAVGDARSMARFYAAVIGEVDGRRRLLSESTVAQAIAPQTDSVPGPGPLAALDGSDRSRFGLGFELPRPGLPMLGPGSFGHAGAGGRLAFAHPQTGIAVAYACTNMVDSAPGPDPRWVPWTRALQRATDQRPA